MHLLGFRSRIAYRQICTLKGLRRGTSLLAWEVLENQ